MRLLHLVLLALLCLLTARSHAEAPQPVATPRPAPIVSPEIDANGNIIFRFKAPSATSVKLWGEWDGREHVLTKNEEGVWSVSLSPLAPDIYGYSFNVDGVTLADPSNTWTKPARVVNTSVLDVPGPRAVPLNALSDNARGTVHLHDYASKTLGRTRRLRVYTPANYDARAKARFPILYLLHGSGDNEATWTEFGRAHLILDTLIAAKKAVPMIVVMTDGHALTDNSLDSRARNVAAFERDLLGDVMPFVESRYRVSAERNQRALAGLSMGGNQALLIGLNHRELFAWIAGMSSAIREPQAPLASFWATPNHHQKPLQLLWLAIGTEDYLLPQNRAFSALLTQAKVPHHHIETVGGHRWTVWRRYLADLAPLLFQ